MKDLAFYESILRFGTNWTWKSMVSPAIQENGH